MPKTGKKSFSARPKATFIAMAKMKGDLVQEVPLRGCVGVAVVINDKKIILDEAEGGIALSVEGGRLVIRLRRSIYDSILVEVVS